MNKKQLIEVINKAVEIKLKKERSRMKKEIKREVMQEVASYLAENEGQQQYEDANLNSAIRNRNSSDFSKQAVQQGAQRQMNLPETKQSSQFQQVMGNEPDDSWRMVESGQAVQGTVPNNHGPQQQQGGKPGYLNEILNKDYKSIIQKSKEFDGKNRGMM
jgi:hypothetical protein